MKKRLLTAVISGIICFGTCTAVQGAYAADNFVKGDVNGDGEFTVADVVSFQKWLLCDSEAELACPKAADLCTDGVLDVFDLCLMKRELVKKITVVEPVAPPKVQPISFANTAELINTINEYDLDKYPEDCREGYSMMYDTIKNDGIIEVGGFEPSRNISVVPYMQYEDLGIYNHTDNGYIVIIYYTDKNIEADGITDYLEKRFKQNVIREISVNDQEVSITRFGNTENTARVCASAFIDENHYYTVKTNVGGTEEELIEFLNGITFTEIPIA